MKKEDFKLGTPARYFNGTREVCGEIVYNREDYDKNGVVFPPKSIKGMSLYKDENYSGDAYRFIVPNWPDVKTFYKEDKECNISAAVKFHMNNKYPGKIPNITYNYINNALNNALIKKFGINLSKKDLEEVHSKVKSNMKSLELRK